MICRRSPGVLQYVPRCATVESDTIYTGCEWVSGWVGGCEGFRSMVGCLVRWFVRWLEAFRVRSGLHGSEGTEYFRAPLRLTKQKTGPILRV